MQHIPPVPPPGRNDTVIKSGKPKYDIVLLFMIISAVLISAVAIIGIVAALFHITGNL